jgi:transcription antitermination factor NusG
MSIAELISERVCEQSAMNPGVAAWYALHLRRRSERTTLSYLSYKGLKTFLPSRPEARCWSDRKRVIDVPLFAGYGFLQTDLSEATRINVLQTEGVVGFVSYRGKAIAIPEKQIQDLRLLTANRMECSIHSELKVGQKVRIRGGCLDGIEGVLASARADRLFVSMDALNRSVAICIEGYRLEAA